MKLENIDKARFKKHLNRFQAALVATLLVLSLGFSTLYIALWGGAESNFWLNAAGVATAAIVIAVLINRFKDHPALTEVMYVWRLKQALNRIYRASAKLNAALEADNPLAVTIQYYFLHGSKHLHQLEDNTLTMDELNTQIAQLEKQIERLGLTPSVDDYRPELLEQL
ncbi:MULTISPECIES: DUF3087 domain-containing protein [Thalassolituus]|jgi:hypothetical protein|uniref:DUF3087 domain-containing protein n=1 Tax=Thalassolituus TaxID=187492 RepID=UPI001E2E27AC|nr:MULTISPECIES: DUF3087 domain-containing protein [Thalassolituus]MCB2385100.1 DUF3087 domain-containing protein [Thalassolituus alkanivorans]MCB2423381.1 DUF3087 domain-containing protein [Thalassolituus alkanivorans]